MRRVLKWAGVLSALLVALALLIAGAGYYWLRATVPSPSGS